MSLILENITEADVPQTGLSLCLLGLSSPNPWCLLSFGTIQLYHLHHETNGCVLSVRKCLILALQPESR